VNALFAAIPGFGNVLLVSLLFWLIFSILGVHLFAGKFYKCVDENNELLPASVIPNKAECLKYPDEYRWVNSKVTFDNVFAGFLALIQVVSEFFSQTSCKILFARYQGDLRSEKKSQQQILVKSTLVQKIIIIIMIINKLVTVYVCDRNGPISQ